MPTNLSALTRYRTINRCLLDKNKRYTLYDLSVECGNTLYEYLGIDKIPGERTIYKDLKDMKSGALGYKAPIVNCRFVEPEYRNGDLAKSYYTYSDPDFSIFNFNLPESDLELLNQSLMVLNHFKEFEFLKEVEGIITKLDTKVNAHNQPEVIGFEKVPNATGHKWLDKIYKAILEQQVLEISYQPFQKEKPTHYKEVHPYYLKEYRNRWYFFGLSVVPNKIPKIFPFGLDRVLDIYNSSLPYIKNAKFDAKEYFKHIIGVTNYEESKPEKVRLLFTSQRGKYVLTKKIHSSQETISQDDRGLVIDLFIVLNKEFTQTLLSFGQDVKVLSPLILVQEVKDSLTLNLNQYD